MASDEFDVQDSENVEETMHRGEGDEHTVFVGNKPFMKLS